MNCKICGQPIYLPVPNELCPKCQGEKLDEYLRNDSEWYEYQRLRKQGMTVREAIHKILVKPPAHL